MASIGPRSMPWYSEDELITDNKQHYMKAIVHGAFLFQKKKMNTSRKNMKGIDVSCVFVKRDANYYDFKPEIETKEQIRDHLNGAEWTVINRFERWWDKYRVSLNEIDTQVRESEAMMYGYLKELGYE